jgi:predicted flap endonuclease-1-like 5' DNA nuclease
MPKSIDELRGASKDLVSKLKEQGISDVEQLLAAAKTTAARTSLAKTVGVDAKMILELANKADLARIKGVAGAFSDLLEEAGVDTVKELASRVPTSLAAKLETVNKEKKISGRMPTADMVTDWISQAKALPKTLEY